MNAPPPILPRVCPPRLPLKAWVGVGLLSASWMFSTGLYHEASPFMGMLLPLLGTLLLRGAVSDAPREKELAA